MSSVCKLRTTLPVTKSMFVQNPVRSSSIRTAIFQHEQLTCLKRCYGCHRRRILSFIGTSQMLSCSCSFIAFEVSLSILSICRAVVDAVSDNRSGSLRPALPLKWRHGSDRKNKIPILSSAGDPKTQKLPQDSSRLRLRFHPHHPTC